MTSYLTAKSTQNLVDIESRYKLIKPRPQLPNFAAYIKGVDLSRPLSQAVKDELYQALLDFELLLLPPQKLTPAQHLDLASAFGPISPGAFFDRSKEHSQIEVIETDAKRPPAIDHWHSDLSWLAEPPAGTVIQITEGPEVGGNTVWASTTKAFAALSPGLKEYLRGLTATHTWEVSNWRNYLEGFGEEVLGNALRHFKPVSHPVVLTHPDSGKEALFVNETFTKKIDGVTGPESRGILHFLYNWIKQPEFIYSHKWERNGIAIWDNRTTQHYASADYWPHRRVNRRVTFDARGVQRNTVNLLSVVGGDTHRPQKVYGT